MKKVKLPQTKIEVYLPEIDFFIDKIRKNESFHFLRVNHGILDAIGVAFNDTEEFFDYLRTCNYEMIADRMLDSGFYKRTYNEKGKHVNVVWHYHRDATTIKEKLISFFRMLNEHELSSRIHVGISVDVGLDDLWGRWAENDPRQIKRTEIATKLAASNEFYHSGVLKHYCIANELPLLFNAINEEEYNVVFMGPSYLRKYKNAFAIKNFYHVETLREGAIDVYDKYIDRLLKISETRKTVVFYASGHIISAYLAEKISDSNIIGIDIGRSFDWTLKSIASQEPSMYNCWITVPDESLINYVKRIRSLSYE